jgi:hypothetical protein
MWWIVSGAFVLVAACLWWILHVRESSITSQRKRDNHYHRLAGELGFKFITDEYFVQLEGLRNNFPVIVYPHNFEGPGLISLLYLQTTVAAKDRNWIEPNLSLGRALVEWKRKTDHDYEVSGEHLPPQLLNSIREFKRIYPYVAVTLPWRFSYSPLLQKAIAHWKNYAVFLAIDSGRYPSKDEIEKAIHDAITLALVVQSETFSDTTG